MRQRIMLRWYDEYGTNRSGSLESERRWAEKNGDTVPHYVYNPRPYEPPVSNSPFIDPNDPSQSQEPLTFDGCFTTILSLFVMASIILTPVAMIIVWFFYKWMM